MSSIPQRALRWPVLALAGLLCLATLAPTAALANADLDIGGTAVISYANGDNVLLRKAPSFDGAVLAEIPEGTVVDVLDGPISDADGNPWFAIAIDGPDGAPLNGFAVGYYLARHDAPTDATPETPATSDATAEAEATDDGSTPSDLEAAVALGVGGQRAEGAAVGTAVVTGTNGDGVRCRASAGYEGAVIAVLAEGTLLTLTGALVGEWQPVNCGGQGGFVHSDFVSYGDSTDNSGTGTDNGTDTGGAVSGYATVVGTNGGGLRCRSAADYGASVIVVLAEGSQVALRGAQQGEWQPVVCAGSNGFVYASYLSTGGGSDTTPEPDLSDGGNSGGLWVGAHAVTTSSLNLRYDASMSAGVAAIAPAGTVVEITGGPTNGFYGVNWDGLSGYMYGDYLSYTDAALSERGGSGNEGVAGPGAGTGSGTGNTMASFALQYVGYPYVWATAGPASFDCSGFTYWVALNVLGIDIGRGLFTQVVAGTPVAYSDLQPGDLVFFQNTYTWGLSHSGIYIGNNQFVHAENETTGVKISDITSQYYSSRWYGAVRLA